MDAITMLRAAALLFVLAAGGGLIMAGIRLMGNRNPPIWLAYGHGLLAGAGLTLMIYAAVTSTIPSRATIALLMLVGAAVGGSVMNLAFHWKQKPLPRGLLYAHALLAVAGLAMLVSAVV